MPRAFTPSERERIGERLIEVARERFSRLGYRRATVDEIARRCGIGKGSVYLFFPSKADLFAEVALRAEREARQELLEEMDGSFSGPRERLERFLRSLLEALTDHPLLWIVVDAEEAPALMRDLSPEAREQLRRADRSFFGRLVGDWRERGLIEDVDPAVLAGLGRALWAVSLHRDIVGTEEYPRVVDVLVRALADRLAPDG